MTEELIKDVEEKMNKAVEFLVSDLSTLRAGRAWFLDPLFFLSFLF